MDWSPNRLSSLFCGLVVALYVVFDSSIDASLAGFILVVSSQLSWKMIWAAMHGADLQLAMCSLERIAEYLEIPQERSDGLEPPPQWPTREAILSFENLEIRYAPHLKPVLKDLTFTVAPKMKIGICGRTGAGKSSLTLALFRGLEASKGCIRIDGLDISKLSLHSLRSRLTIINQDPTLFSGTIRFNLDPFNDYSDAECWKAIGSVGMSRVESGPNGKSGIASLYDLVSEGGRNFSVDERQLLALARGLMKLRTSPILVLDEASASLDDEADRKMQAVIRREMSDATILCIAHRLNTVIDYDRIMVLDAGRIVEMGRPADLLADENSALSSLVNHSGDAKQLRLMAGKAIGTISQP